MGCAFEFTALSWIAVMLAQTIYELVFPFSLKQAKLMVEPADTEMLSVIANDEI